MPLYENLLYSMALLAMVMDLKTETIPNEGICLFWGTGLAYRIARDGWAGAAGWFWGAVLPVLLLAALFLPRMIGAGDIKLLSALGGMMGSAAVVKCIGISFFCGAVLGAAILIDTGTLFLRLRHFADYFRTFIKTKTVVPYYQRGERLENIHFSVPVLMAVMLHMGGIYS